MDVCSVYSGIGGLDLGFQAAGFHINQAIDMDEYCIQAYKANISDNIICGLVKEHIEEFLPHDLLIGGPSCQPYSTLGLMRGLDDERAKAFYDVLEITRKYHTKVLVLENVANLLRHQNGETFRYMEDCLDYFGYYVYHQILDTKNFGIPANRRRVFIVCFRKEYFKHEPFKFPSGFPLKTTLQELLDEIVDTKYFLSKKTAQNVLDIPSGNGTRLINPTVAKTLTTKISTNNKVTQNTYVTDTKNATDSEKSTLRRLTPNECRKLQGFPDSWRQVTSDFQAYKQFGNAVTVPVAKALAETIKEYMNKNLIIPTEEGKKNE
ncbi:DNA (cytosine-5-)-methyltransferase [Enterococcus faecalis]|uniref:DNA (cytosine-5-)-methyltransferase n=1 Tax=Enterococcus faecalis TaxID=1351 RepID=UPI001922616A|nr:DNA cytosine methyltransferase [Enterococcus faecalis]HAP4881142.1 DNA cytosine methyltransferase [Enterococcus faecalis]HCY9412712.1 DNA cytosine methyltransferase [Enterococcus faecalis]